MIKAKVAAVTLAAGLLLALTAAPASADLVGGSCNAGGSYTLSVLGSYVDGLWRTQSYYLGGGGDRSNVNIRIYQGSTLRWAYNSPDNRHAGVWYDIIPQLGSNPPWHDPNGGYPVFTSGSARVTYTAIFDRAWWSDPSCTITSYV
jgi:hypothetical protein